MITDTIVHTMNQFVTPTGATVALVTVTMTTAGDVEGRGRQKFGDQAAKRK